MALILVLFVVALASTIVVSVAYTTSLSSRVSSTVAKSLQAEYLLKSALHFAQVLLMIDPSDEGSPNALWKQFQSGNLAIPPNLLGLEGRNISIRLEIRPEGAKFPLRHVPPSMGTTKWADALVRLMDGLGFRQDDEEDITGLTPNKLSYTPEELVGNLIDYMDPDTESYDNGPYQGVESALPPGAFPNRPIQKLAELNAIPGFTPARVAALYRFATAENIGAININAAPREVLKCLDPELSDANIQAILDFRKDPAKVRSSE